MNTQTVGFVGLGNMGGRMTGSLLRGGIGVDGFDPRPGIAEQLGANPIASAAEVARTRDVILMSLPDSHVVESVVLGEEGLIANGRSGQIIVDLSTSAPASTRRLSALAAERGIAYIDAGISGGAAAAEAGKLTLMVGGDAAAIDAVRPVFAAIATNVYVMGESGAGHITKLLNNFLNAISLSATAEVMVAAKKSGLELETVLDVINKSSGVTFASINRFPNIIHGNYMEGGLTTRLMTKDVVLYLEHLASIDIASLNGSAPLAAFGLASALGYGDVISNRVVDAIGDVSGGVRLHTPAEAAANEEVSA